MKSKQKSKKQTNRQLDPFSIYGARISSSEKYVNVTLVQGEDDEKTYRNALVKIKGKYIGVKVKEDSVVLTIPRLDVEDEDEDEDSLSEDDEDEDEDDDKDDPLKGQKPVDEIKRLNSLARLIGNAKNAR